MLVDAGFAGPCGVRKLGFGLQILGIRACDRITHPTRLWVVPLFLKRPLSRNRDDPMHPLTANPDDPTKRRE
jgi:hypothetical protein